MTEHRLADYRPPPWLVEGIHLDISLAPHQTQVKARLHMRPNPKVPKAAREPICLDGVAENFRSLSRDGSPLPASAYTLTDTTLTIPAPIPGPHSLEITTEIDPEANKALMGLYRSRGLYCTQCEPEGFRRITFFPDRPDVLAVYTVRVTASRAEAPVLLANGNLIESGDIPGTDRHYALWHDPFPKPSYLFALVAGELACVTDRFVTASGREVALHIYVEAGKEDRTAWAMDCLKRAMRWDEVHFGREYDLDRFMIVAVSDFNMGAMENKGLNIFNDKYILASPDTATDQTFAAIEAIIAHEYFHNWTGNRITCRDWFQLRLKEGLTVFRDQEFTATERDPTVKRITDVSLLRRRQFPEDAGPLAHPVRPDRYREIANFYTATVYEKGAEVVRMLRTLLGERLFRQGMDLYFQRHDGEAVTVEQFLACFAEVSGRDLNQFFLWYTQAGTPELLCQFSYDPHRRTARLEVTQTCPPTPEQADKAPFHIPLRLGLLAPDGSDMPLELVGKGPVTDGVLEIRRRREVFEFQNLPDRPVPSLLRGFSAPVKLISNLSEQDRDRLMTKDGDLFNRWDMTRSVALALLTRNVAALTAGKPERRGQRLITAFRHTLSDDTLSPAYRAQFAQLPTETEIALAVGDNVDPAHIFHARQGLMAGIGESLWEVLGHLFDSLADDGPYSPAPEPAGRRALRHAALRLLAATGRRRALDRLAQLYGAATNMTERAFALMELARWDIPARTKALAHFYETWQQDHLVIDLWFTAQAVSPLDSTPAQVTSLLAHPLFSLENPNKVWALIGSFANQNLLQFHRPDGAGYDLVLGQIKKIDAFNPQLAARLLGSFSNWHRLEPRRRAKAQTALTAFAHAATPSPDTQEILDKLLNAQDAV